MVMGHSYLPLPRLSIPYQIRGVMNNELNELKAPYDVVIVGSGYSGTMVAVHLTRAQRGLRVGLIAARPSDAAWRTVPPIQSISSTSRPIKWARFPTISVTSTDGLWRIRRVWARP